MKAGLWMLSILEKGQMLEMRRPMRVTWRAARAEAWGQQPRWGELWPWSLVMARTTSGLVLCPSAREQWRRQSKKQLQEAMGATEVTRNEIRFGQA